MPTILLIPDSFKGTLSAPEVCRAMDAGIARRLPEAAVRALPAADGGEGTVDAFLTALGGEKCSCTVCGPRFAPVDAFYGLLPDGTAVIEMAACAGLPLVGAQKDPEGTTTYGVGQLILAALERGVRRFLIGLGGSATNDGGCGCAAACGVGFYDACGGSFVPTGRTLRDIHRIDLASREPRLAECTFTVLCDIDNPLCGEQGAAAVFGPQKGADAAMIHRLDAGLAHLARLWQRDLDCDLSGAPGGGAAGGMGAGMAAFFGGTLRPGIDLLLELADFDRLAASADLILTGEGCLDAQTLRGKTVYGVVRRAKPFGVPVIAVAGGLRGDLTPLYQQGLTAAFSINRLPLPLEESAPHTAENITRTVEDIVRLWEGSL